MKRRHFFEIHDQDWCPRAIRDAATDYLQFVITKTKAYAGMVPVLAAALERAGVTKVVDLCSGAGGPWSWLQPLLALQGVKVSVCLTDKHPNLGAIAQTIGSGNQAIRYHAEAVNATSVSEDLGEFRTMFSAFHHFKPPEARAILADAAQKRKGIAIFEGTHNSALGVFVVFFVPLMVFLITPFIRPFSWSRLFWTYVIPVMPLVIFFDGLVSSLRTYGIAELRELTETIESKSYQWEIGEVKGPAGPIPITFLIGLPVDQS